MERQDLKNAGLKVTAPRLKILKLLEESAEHHFGAEDIYRTLNDSGDEIGLATVYRVLAQFERAGLVTRHNFEGGRAVYELDDGRQAEVVARRLEVRTQVIEGDKQLLDTLCQRGALRPAEM